MYRNPIWYMTHTNLSLVKRFFKFQNDIFAIDKRYIKKALIQVEGREEVKELNHKG